MRIALALYKIWRDVIRRVVIDVISRTETLIWNMDCFSRDKILITSALKLFESLSPRHVSRPQDLGFVLLSQEEVER